MIYGMYAVRDSATRQYMSILTDINDDCAMRNFDMAVLDNQVIHFRPSDFSLYKLGSYDSETGKVVACPPECLRLGSESEVYLNGRSDIQNDYGSEENN